MIWKIYKNGKYIGRFIGSTRYASCLWDMYLHCRCKHHFRFLAN